MQWIAGETNKASRANYQQLQNLQNEVVDLQKAQENMVTEDKIKQWIQEAIQSAGVPQPAPPIVQKETGGFDSVQDFEKSEVAKSTMQA